MRKLRWSHKQNVVSFLVFLCCESLPHSHSAKNLPTSKLNSSKKDSRSTSTQHFSLDMSLITLITVPCHQYCLFLCLFSQMTMNSVWIRICLNLHRWCLLRQQREHFIYKLNSEREHSIYKLNILRRTRSVWIKMSHLIF